MVACVRRHLPWTTPRLVASRRCPDDRRHAVAGHDFNDPEAPGHSDTTPAVGHGPAAGHPDGPRTSRTRAQEWRRLCAEVIGTFFLVLVAAGGPMIDHAVPGFGGPGRGRRGPGTHGDGRSSCPWARCRVPTSTRRSPSPSRSVGTSRARGCRPTWSPSWSGRVAGRLVPPGRGPRVGPLRLELPGARVAPRSTRFLMEAVLTLGLVERDPGHGVRCPAGGPVRRPRRGRLHRARPDCGPVPISGASMNPVRTFGPDIVSVDFTSGGSTWPARCSVRAAVGMAYLLRGPGGGHLRVAGRPGRHQAR